MALLPGSNLFGQQKSIRIVLNEQLDGRRMPCGKSFLPQILLVGNESSTPKKRVWCWTICVYMFDDMKRIRLCYPEVKQGLLGGEGEGNKKLSFRTRIVKGMSAVRCLSYWSQSHQDPNTRVQLLT